MSFTAFAVAGWIPYTVVLGLIIIFAFLYLRHYQDQHQRDALITIVGTLSLATVLACTALVPVDIFLVSSLKDSDGLFKDWVNNGTVSDVVDTLTIAYYSLYGIIVFFAFLVIPFSYFFFEEDDLGVTVGQKMCAAFKYTLGTIIVVVALLLIGVFVRPSGPPTDDKLDFIKEVLTENRGENALSFVVGILTLLGLILWVVYTAVGLFGLPIGMIKGTSLSTQGRELSVATGLRNARENSERARTQRTRGKNDYRRIATAEDRERTLAREERIINEVQSNWIYKVIAFLRPFQVLFGLAFLIVSLFLVVSFFITSLDKALNSLGASV
eukprot:Colp12_sorted_trinity150504_noHs@9730